MLENSDIDLLVEIFDKLPDVSDEKINKLAKKIKLIQKQIKVQTDAQEQIQKIHEEMKEL